MITGRLRGSLALWKIRIFGEKSSILKFTPSGNGLEDTDEGVIISGQCQSKWKKERKKVFHV